MTRWRVAAAILAGVLIGFFLTLAGVFGIGLIDTTSVPRSSADAKDPTAAQLASTAYGKAQAATHLALVRHAAIVPYLRPLKKGDSGGEVKQLQRAMIRAVVRPPSAKATGYFGPITERQLKVFQRRVKLPATGVYGPATHHEMQPYYDLAGRRILQAIRHAHAQYAYFKSVAHAASVAWLHRSSMRYSQSFTRAFLPPLPGFPRATDCSGYATWLFKVSGLPDPSGFQYRVVGWTGTLATHGARISANAAFHVGDLVFYGGGYPYGHVAIVVDAIRRLVSSHGGPGIRVEPFNYRPVSAVRRYF